MKINLDHPAVPWMVKHVAAAINKYLIRDFGNSFYKRIKGRQCIEPIAEFGLSVLFKPSSTKAEKAHKESWRDTFLEGIYLGSSIRTSETLIRTGHGVYKAGAVPRRPVE